MLFYGRISNNILITLPIDPVIPLDVPYRDMNDSLWQCSGLHSKIAVIYSLIFSVISLITCLVTLIQVCVLKLHKTLDYRLALYQVLSAMEFSILWIAALSPIYIKSDYLSVVINALLLGSMGMKLMFTVWIVVHLFALAVFHKKLLRLEPLYVASSLLTPVIVTAVILPMMLENVCMIEDIMYIIVFGVLVLTSWLIITMGTVLCYRSCRRRNLELSEYDKQHKKALCEMLPLLMYPILFLLLTAPLFVRSVYDITTSTFGSGFMFSICAPLWSFTTSMSLFFHPWVVRHFKKTRLQNNRNALQYNRGQQLEEGSVTTSMSLFIHPWVVRPFKKTRLQNNRNALQYNRGQQLEEGSVTVNETTRLCQRSDTHYTAPTED